MFVCFCFFSHFSNEKIWNCAFYENRNALPLICTKFSKCDWFITFKGLFRTCVRVYVIVCVFVQLSRYNNRFWSHVLDVYSLNTYFWFFFLAKFLFSKQIVVAIVIDSCISYINFECISNEGSEQRYSAIDINDRWKSADKKWRKQQKEASRIGCGRIEFVGKTIRSPGRWRRWHF